MGRFINKYLVFKYDNNRNSDFLSWTPDFKWFIADNENTKHLFINDKNRMIKYEKHLLKGHKGIYIYDDSSWITAGWISKQYSLPHHIKLKFNLDNDYWLFGFHTNEKYRKQGYYRKILKLIIKEIFSTNMNAKIYIDCIHDSVVSNMFREIGFIDFGIYKSVRIPKTSIIFGKMKLLANNCINHN